MIIVPRESAVHEWERIDITGFQNHDDYDGLGLAELVRKGEVKPSELLEEAIIRIENLNPKLNVVIQKMYDSARHAVSRGLTDGSFRGVPFLFG